MRKFRPSGALWAHAGFMRLWAAQTVSSFGARIAREGFAMTAILTIHAPPSELGILAAMARGPGVVVGLVAGGFVDRSSRRRVMMASDLLRAALILTIPLAAWLHLLTMMQLYVCAALVGAGNALFEIADHAFLPSLVERENLLDGNAKLGTTDSIAEIGGPALAGTLFQLFTAPLAMLTTAFTYLISAAFLSTVSEREIPPEASLERPRWYRDVGETWRFAMREPLLRPLMCMAIVTNVASGFFAALYLVYGLKVLGMSPALMGVNIAMGGIGALIGAAFAPRLAGRFGFGVTLVTAFFATDLFLLLVPLAHGPPWFSTSMMMAAQLGGDAMALVPLILMTSLRQSIVPPAMLARNAALVSAIVGGMTLTGALSGGFLGNYIGIRATLFLAVATLVAGHAFTLFSPLRNLEKIPDSPS
ncbi:MAG TPA: MFS transporter [Rhizomicrobium sp.]